MSEIKSYILCMVQAQSIAIEEKDILGEKQAYYIIKMPGEVKVMVPTSKAEQVGVRNIIGKEEAAKVMTVLRRK